MFKINNVNKIIFKIIFVRTEHFYSNFITITNKNKKNLFRQILAAK